MVIGAFGRFVAKKGFNTLLDALSILQRKKIPFQAIIAGDGVLKNQLLKSVSILNLSKHVSFTGWVDPASFFEKIDLFVLPSHHEPFGNALLEAYSCGKPTICTNSEGPKEIATDQYDALIVPINDPSALSQALATMLSNPQIRKKLGQNALHTYKMRHSSTKLQYSLEKIIDSISTHTNKIKSPQ